MIRRLLDAAVLLVVLRLVADVVRDLGRYLAARELQRAEWRPARHSIVTLTAQPTEARRNRV